MYVCVCLAAGRHHHWGRADMINHILWLSVPVHGAAGSSRANTNGRQHGPAEWLSFAHHHHHRRQCPLPIHCLIIMHPPASGLAPNPRAQSAFRGPPARVISVALDYFRPGGDIVSVESEQTSTHARKLLGAQYLFVGIRASNVLGGGGRQQTHSRLAPVATQCPLRPSIQSTNSGGASTHWRLLK